MPLFLLALLTLLRFFHPAAPAPAEAIVGRWRTADKISVVQIASRDGVFSGQVVGPLTPVRLDARNPDPAQRHRPLLGITLLQGFRYADGAWTNGTIYDPNNGKTYACILRLKATNALEVRGYVGLSLFGRTETWTRQP
ncbi:hypothetical protein A0257_21395 [Hymenobacter psoromatis]|nr:hypothetical protein A0257_21395 [Hymenobacter psoromatis]